MRDDEAAVRATVPRGRPRDAAVDDRILNAAFRQVVDVGLGGLSIEAVAAEAGVAKTTIYRRYPTRRDLVIAALGRQAPVPVPPPDLPSRESLAWFVRTVATALVESGAIRILASLLVEERTEPGVPADFRSRLIAPRREVIVDLVRRGIERGEVRPDADALLVTEMVAGAIFGHHVILGQGSTDAWLDSLIDHLWRAVAAH